MRFVFSSSVLSEISFPCVWIFVFSGRFCRDKELSIIFGLEKFKRIVLDFKGVTGIGQGFADEIFRVFQSNHPESSIESINTSPAVEYMIKRAKK